MKVQSTYSIDFELKWLVYDPFTLIFSHLGLLHLSKNAIVNKGCRLTWEKSIEIG